MIGVKLRSHIPAHVRMHLEQEIKICFENSQLNTEAKDLIAVICVLSSSLDKEHCQNLGWENCC